MATATQQFIKSSYFAVVGASTNREKFGNRVLRWYLSNDLDVTPINPKETTIENLTSKPSIHELTFPDKTALSVITPPAVTLKILQDAKQLGIKHIWIQPGGEDQKVIDFANSNQDLDIILGGPCILVQGPGLLQSRGRL